MIDPDKNIVVVTLPESGIRVCISEEGKGEPVLFVHGLMSDQNVWFGNIRHLRSQFRCIAIDLPGHGQSDKKLKEYSIKLFADVVKEVIALLRLDKVKIVGHSMGGQVLIKFTSEHPGLVSRLALMAPAGLERFSAQDRKLLLDYSVKNEPQVITDAWLAYACSLNYSNKKDPNINNDIARVRLVIKETGDENFLQMLRSCMLAMIDEPVYSLLRTLKVPVQIIFGEDDHLIPNKLLHPFLTTQGIASDASAEIVDASYDIIKHAGHFVQIEGGTSQIQKLKDFLRQ